MKRARTIVVGGGVYGACIAYELARAGAEVTLVERDPIGAHASGKNPGNLNPLLATPPAMVVFALECFRRHERLHAELTALGLGDYGLASVRRAMLCFEEADRAELAPVEAAFAAEPGFGARWLDGDALRSLEPRLSPAVKAGLVLDGNRSLDPRRFNRALVAAAVRLGARLVSAAVTDVLPGPGGYALATDRGDLSCDALVLACGPWPAPWLAHPPIAPIEPVKGEMLRMRLRGDDIANDFTRGPITLYRRGHEVWVGVTRERAGLDERPSAAARQTLLAGAASIMPGIADAEVLEHLAALRPQTPDGLPHIGLVAGHERAFVANGGGAKGVLTSVGVARVIRDRVLGSLGETNERCTFTA